MHYKTLPEFIKLFMVFDERKLCFSTLNPPILFDISISEHATNHSNRIILFNITFIHYCYQYITAENKATITKGTPL